MLAFVFLVALAGFLGESTAQYVLQDDYTVDKFFSMFDFFTASDPTNGYVNYVDQNTAAAAGLVSTSSGSVYMGVDHTNVATGRGRTSVRITSKKSYTEALIILDLSHMPGGICGTWPAFWTVGPNWPAAGEIDIIEGVNSQTANSMALHTTGGCSISNTGMFSGSVTTPNCDVAAAGQATNAGCQIETHNSASYGSGFNAGQGGVYATEWTSSQIKVWFFPRGAVPSDVSSANPDPSNWGNPMAAFGGGSCAIDNFFHDHQIVFDTTFCGDWAGNVWSSDPVCGKQAPTCQSFVQNNPSAFTNAYWTVNSLRVYQSNGGTSSGGGGSPSGAPSGVPSGVPISPSQTQYSPLPSVSAQGGGGGGGGYGGGNGGNGGGTPQNSGVPGGNGGSGDDSSAYPTGGFSRGGNGRQTKTFGVANFAAVSAPSSPASASPLSAPSAGVDPSSTVGPPMSTRGTGSAPVSPPETTPPAATDETQDNAAAGHGGAGGAGGGGAEYVTVTALTGDYFNDRRRAATPETAPDTTDFTVHNELVNAHLRRRSFDSHRHHAFGHRVAAAAAVNKE